MKFVEGGWCNQAQALLEEVSNCAANTATCCPITHGHARIPQGLNDGVKTGSYGASGILI